MQPSGILILHKPRGMTSHDCVYKVRRLFQTKKVGHTGTLDPDVNGVLPICIGKATKVVEYMSGHDKMYEGEVTIGFSTTTEDRSGEIVETKEIEEKWTSEQLQLVLNEFLGEIVQIPPMYSAVKVKGKRLYEYAREGKVIERPSREVTIYSIDLCSEVTYRENTASFRFKVLCSKGTYIRTLAVDIGKRLGYPAHMSDLIRLTSGPYTLNESYSFSQLEELKKEGTILSVLRPFDTAISMIPKQIVDRETEQFIKNGAVISSNIDQKRFTVYNEDGECLAIYKQHPTKDGYIKPEKMFWTGN